MVMTNYHVIKEIVDKLDTNISNLFELKVGSKEKQQRIWVKVSEKSQADKQQHELPMQLLNYDKEKDIAVLAIASYITEPEARVRA